MDLAATSGLLRLLADPTRLRLLALIEREELTVAELAGVLRLAQPRVSTHLAKLKEAGLVRDRRAGVSAYYRWNAEADGKTAELVQALRASLDNLGKCYRDAKAGDGVALMSRLAALISPERGGWYAERLQSPAVQLHCLPL